MSRVLGRSFKISKNQANGYGYARPGGMKRNGVTTIAAINGRGSYATANRSARSVMSKLKRNARPAAARRALTASEKAAFKARMDRARGMSANRSTSASQSARKAWGKKLTRGKRFRVGTATYGRKPKARRLTAGVYVANRRKKAGSKTMARRRKRAASPTKKRRSSKRRRTSSTKRAATPRKRRKARKGAARRKTAAKKTTVLAANRRRRVAKKAAPKRRRKARKGAARRKTTKRRSSARRRKAPRKLKANSRRRKSARRNPKRRRSHRKNTMMANRRKGTKRSHKANRRRRHKRNGRSLFRRNGVGGFLKVGATVLAGFALHRVLSNMIAPRLLAMVAPKAAVPASTSGFDQTNIYGMIANLGVAGLTGFAVHKLVKNDETKRLVIGGIVVSAAQSLIVSLLQKFAPGAAANALAGPESSATRMAAMFGLGGSANIMPNYTPIGEYFAANGLGEYFGQPTNGLGEYFAATNGLGTYEPNSDLMQAAAGMGSHDYQGNHIDPSGDLDRQLTIAEAAAGVGGGALFPYSAAAGMGGSMQGNNLMQAAAGFGGFGAIDSLPSGDTWIPGTTDGQIWAGTRAITNDQGVNQMDSAGVLETEGGQGIFG